MWKTTSYMKNLWFNARSYRLRVRKGSNHWEERAPLAKRYAFCLGEGLIRYNSHQLLVKVIIRLSNSTYGKLHSKITYNGAHTKFLDELWTDISSFRGGETLIRSFARKRRTFIWTKSSGFVNIQLEPFVLISCYIMIDVLLTYTPQGVPVWVQLCDGHILMDWTAVSEEVFVIHLLIFLLIITNHLSFRNYTSSCRFP